MRLSKYFLSCIIISIKYEATTKANDEFILPQPTPALMPNSNALMVPNVLTPDGSVTEMMTVPMHLMSFLAVS